MLKYLIGFFLNLFNKRVSLFAVIDYKSKVNKKSKVNRSVKVFDSIIDSYSYVGGKSDIICADIGKFCSIANNCAIGLATHSLKNISTSPIFSTSKNGTGSSWTSLNTYKQSHRVTIGNDVWIGTRVIIMGGLNIGHGAIIGAGAIVTKDIPDYAIAVGVPARVINFRFKKPIIEKLLELKWWDMPEEKLREKIKIFQIENFSLNDLEKI